MELNIYVSMATVHVVTCVLLCTQLMTSHVGGERLQNDQSVVSSRYDKSGRFYRRYHKYPSDDEDVYSGSGSGSGDYYYREWERAPHNPPYRQNPPGNSNSKGDDDIYLEPQQSYTESPNPFATASSSTSSIVTVLLTTISCLLIWLNG